MNKQLHQLHLVATELSCLVFAKPWKGSGKSVLEYHKQPIERLHHPSAQYDQQHLYITSNEEIKEGDWYLANNEAFKADISFKSNGRNNPNDRGYRKIVATTNPDIWTNHAYHPNYNNNIGHIPQSLIQAYIKAYNEGKTMTEVWLEIHIDRCAGCGDNPQPEICRDKHCSIFAKTLSLKLSPNGEVIVAAEEKMYTKEQLKQAAWNFGALLWINEYGEDVNKVKGNNMIAIFNKWFDKIYPQ